MKGRKTDFYQGCFNHRLWLIIGLFTALLFGQILGYESKWDRVDALARSLTQGEAWNSQEAARRLQVKEDILAILYAQEPDYPIYYVDEDASGNHNGTSWENAFSHIQDGIDAAYNNGEGWVWVAEGTYSHVTEPRGITQVDGYSLISVVQLMPRVMVFGGFAGDETSLDQRNPEMHVCTIRGWKGSSQSSPGVRSVDMGHQTLIDGFRIFGSGFEVDGMRWDRDGGGIKTRGWFSIIRNNTVTGCTAKNGGGIAVQTYNAENPDYDFPDHQESRPGYCPILERNTIYNNQAVCGAGIQIRDVEALLCHNKVVYNHDDLNKTTIRHKGIEVVVDDAYSDRPVLVNNIIWGNVPSSAYIMLNLYIYYGPGHTDGCLGYNNYIQSPTHLPKNAAHNTILDVNPQFVNINEQDYTLKSTSPCINAGLPLPDGTPTDIGFYEMRYFLTIDDGGVGAQQTGEGWHIAGENVTISTDSVYVDSEGTTRYTFQRWEGAGSGSYTGSSRTAIIQMDEEITETIVWNPGYALQINSNTDADQLSGWYSDQSTVQIIVPSRIEDVDARRVFLHWNMDMGGAVTTSTDTSLTLTMTQPVVLTAVWDTEYRIHVSSVYGVPTPSGEHWVSAGTDLTVSVDPLVSGATGTQYRFLLWHGNGEYSYTGEDAEFSITVSGPIEETAIWQPEHFLTVFSEQGRGSPLGQSWYNEGASALISVDSLVEIDFQNRFRFSGWTGSGTGAYTGSERTHTVIINHPVTETVVWRQECPIDVAINPENAGIVNIENVMDGWGVLGTQVRLKAEGDADDGYGFAGWSGYFSGRENPVVFLMTEPVALTANFELGDVRVETEPSGLSITVDDANFSSPRIFYWLPGETYTLGTPTPQQTGALSRQLFDRWSDNQARQHTVVIPENPVVYTAYFQPEYSVSVDTEHGSSSVVGNGWYPPGTPVVLSIDSLADDASGTRYRFVEWSVESGQGVNASTCSISFTLLQGGVLQKAHWQGQHRLDISVSPSYGGDVTLSDEGPWYDSGTDIQLTAVPVDTNFSFAGWSGDVESDSPWLTVTMDQHIKLTARFITHTVFSPEISGFADTTLFEDGEIVWSRAKFENIVSDKNDPVDSLRIRVNNGAPFYADWDGTAMRLAPYPDWQGTAQVVLEVSDPRNLTACDTFSVMVISLPDPPGHFSLIHPEHFSELPDSTETITFLWHEARNVDAGDVVSYELIIGSDSTFQGPDTRRISSIPDTFLVLNRNTLESGIYWCVRAADQQGYVTLSNEIYYCVVQTDIEQCANGISDFKLGQNYPNPFNAGTQITYQLPRRSEVRLCIYNARGREIRKLVQQIQEAGQHCISWDAKNSRNMDVPSGIYLMKLLWDGHTVQKKMLLIR
ncbi:T9SS type A sorting domain-containing protein [bacterium]|nr:T9SS type A sorting domain-containing protein [bacterium]